MARGRFWSADDSSRLRRLIQAGALDAEVANILGRPRETITRKRKQLGLGPGCSPAHRLALLRLGARRTEVSMTEEQANGQERPTIYRPELGQELCRRLSQGSSLRRILHDPGMPARETVRRWQREQPEFAAGYARAREDLVEALAEDALDRADDAGSTLEVATSRNFTVAAKWCASLLAPRTVRAAKPDGFKPDGPKPDGPKPDGYRLPSGETVEQALARARRMREGGRPQGIGQEDIGQEDIGPQDIEPPDNEP
jgi:hypothetical protein